MALTWRADAVQGSGGNSAAVPQIIQVADEATAIAESTANPNNFYFWV